MVGADPFITKSVLHVTRSPWSIATVTDDVEETFGRYVIDGAMRAAGDGDMTRAIRVARRLEGRVLGRHHAVRERQRSLDLSGGRLRHPVDLPARSSGHLHSHHRRSARQHRADQDQAVGVHRGGQRLLPGDDAGPRRGAAAADLRQRARTPGRGRPARVGDGLGRRTRRRRDQHRQPGAAARAAAAALVGAVRQPGRGSARRHRLRRTG